VTEPSSPEAVAAWIDAAQRQRDPFEQVRLASHAHREQHGRGCTVYPTSSGPLLSVLAAGVQAKRILEVGCGLGYSALCLTAGSGAFVETIERDVDHAGLAELEIAEAGYSDHIRVLRGTAADLLPKLDGQYDLIFSDADPPEMPIALDHYLRLLRPDGLLVSANLFLAQFVAELPGLEHMADYRQRIIDDERLQSAFVPGGLALSCLRGPR
jgi:predicted O-methyltransferase YrrM